ncbi:MAG: hypothetical protein RIS19_980 [Actinomycetota bacterium]
MLFNSQPALRHFAVLERVKRASFGTIWLVQDRRGLGQSQFLLVPSRARAWPLLLASLSKQQASPVRLRNGKVALLVSVSEVKEIVEVLRKRRKTETQKLNAISGFEAAEPSSRKKMIIMGTIAAVLAIAALLPRPVVADVEVVAPLEVAEPIDRCSMPIEVESIILGQVAKLKTVSIGGTKYKVASMQRLGGLIQLKLKRVCDQKYFRADAWSQSNQVIVSKVY